jgi:hypothetical protein
LNLQKIRRLSILTVLVPCSAWAGVNPTSVLINLYSASVSVSADCSKPRVVFKSEVPIQVDFANNPTLGGGSLADGTYRCIILRISDVVSFVPETTSGACVAGTTYKHHLLESDPAYQNFDATNWGAMATSAANLNKPEIIPIVLTTSGSGSTTAGMVAKPTSATDTGPLYLSSAFVVNGTKSSKINAILNGKVDGSNPPCYFNSFSFSVTQ